MRIVVGERGTVDAPHPEDDRRTAAMVADQSNTELGLARGKKDYCFSCRVALIRNSQAVASTSDSPAAGVAVNMSIESQSSFAPYAHHSNEEVQIPGRRTPLGNVGLSGFYFPGGGSVHGSPSDENNPESTVSVGSR